jgi:hypothetical protein
VYALYDALKTPLGASGAPRQIVNTASALTVLPQTDSATGNNSATVTVTSK